MGFGGKRDDIWLVVGFFEEGCYLIFVIGLGNVFE